MCVTETLCLEENNSRLKEKVAAQQSALQALGKNMEGLVHHWGLEIVSVPEFSALNKLYGEKEKKSGAHKTE